MRLPRCSTLFDRDAARGEHFSLVGAACSPRRSRDRARRPGRSCGPGRITFFFRNSAEQRVVAYYPGPMGPTSPSSVSRPGKAPGRQPGAGDMARRRRVACLVNRARPPARQWLVGVDECYRLTGLIRMRWKGLGGGRGGLGGDRRASSTTSTGVPSRPRKQATRQRPPRPPGPAGGERDDSPGQAGGGRPPRTPQASPRSIGNYGRQERPQTWTAHSDARRSTGVNPKGREPIDPRHAEPLAGLTGRLAANPQSVAARVRLDPGARLQGRGRARPGSRARSRRSSSSCG